MSAGIRLVLVCLVVINVFFNVDLLEAAEVGRVISLTPGAVAQRDGRTVALALKSPVHDTDVLITDASGRVQILFDDDSTVALGSGARLALGAVVPKGRKPVFKADLSQGLARVITGKIVEKNPDGFTLSTPEATVGIRGTMFAVEVEKKQSRIFVFNTSRQVVVNGVEVPSDFKITFPGGKMERLTPGDAGRVGTLTASRPAVPAARAEALAAGLAVSGGEPARSASLMASGQTTQNTQTIADSLELGSPEVIGSVVGPTRANITGTLTSSNLTAGSVPVSGTFAFTADLDTGRVTNAAMAASGQTGPNYNGGGTPERTTGYNLAGGSGYINGNHFNVNNFSGSGTVVPGESSDLVWKGDPQTMGAAVPGANLNGTITRGPSGMTVNGYYTVNFKSISGNTITGGAIDRGTLSGGGS